MGMSGRSARARTIRARHQPQPAYSAAPGGEQRHRRAHGERRAGIRQTVHDHGRIQASPRHSRAKMCTPFDGNAEVQPRRRNRNFLSASHCRLRREDAGWRRTPPLGKHDPHRKWTDRMARGGIPKASIARLSNMIAAILWKREIKRRAFANLSLGPDATTVPGDDLLDDGETDAGSRKLGSVQPLKNPKQSIRVLHVEAGAVVAHMIDGLAITVGRADLDPRVGLERRYTLWRCRAGSSRRTATWTCRHAQLDDSQYRSRMLRLARTGSQFVSERAVHQFGHIDRLVFAIPRCRCVKKQECHRSFKFILTAPSRTKLMIRCPSASSLPA